MPGNMRKTDSWHVAVSSFAKKTFNPIRNIVENMKIEPHPEKEMIALSIGDPTVFGNLRPADEVVEAVVESVRSGKHNGYIASTGQQKAREAVAEYMNFPGAPVDAKDVIICSGCSCALDICISALCDRGSSLLVPRPGFPLYTTLAEGFGVTSKFYNLLPEKNWQVDLAHLESLIDHTTAAILVNNPSNPCGSVFPREHLEAIAALAVKHKIPIIADEIYDHFVFEGQEYHPIASVHPELPVLACGGLTKRFLVPGWRTGWIAIHDRGGVLSEVSGGLRALSQRIIGSNTLVQGALPTILHHTPQSFFDDTIQQVQSNARYCYEAIKQIKGLSPTSPQGAMYMMVGIDLDKFPKFSSDLEFVEKMVAEQSVFCLPGKCFQIPNFFRIVLTVPEAKMKEACERMKAFCKEHHVASINGSSEETTAKRVKLEVTSGNNMSTEQVETTENGFDEPSINGNDDINVSQNELFDIVKGASKLRKNLDFEDDILREEVAEIQSAMIKDCTIRSIGELVDEMECNP